ncbi:filament-like plant protein isoform X2 [Hevea brasiliensis]|uniref:filament-like plant protein isoform X2 n=1 Tax=Hevea brasiliensis TaxID=3981 RepID=UPI0025DE22C8|nr:filament-like plant protein isoform X2 [Hevea brasiliensis]
MDRRSWLWRRKSSEKNPGETDSPGSISSHFERFSDDQSPEVTSKAVPRDEEITDNVKTLTLELSAALLNISAKEELVKQHAKVAEEAVSGWEKAEKELVALKQQLEVAVKNKVGLEDRVGHLDAALKECMRQLRQAREEQEQRINEALAQRIREWESIKSELETKLVQLEAQLQTAKSEATTSVDSDLRRKLEAAEKDNSSLKLELLSQAEELEIRIMERDLSIQAAETASKQHLESIKKVAKLEAECRRLKTFALKASPSNDHKSLTASSIYVESFADSQSDSGERLLAAESDAHKISRLEINECEPSCSDSWASALITELHQFKNHKALGSNLMVPSVEIDLMNDFLEMERLAALLDTESGIAYLEAGPLSDQANGVESLRKAELETMIQRTSELEERLEKLEGEKVESEKALTECQRQLEMSQSGLKEVEGKLVELLVQLALSNETKQLRDQEMEHIKAKRDVAESQLLVAEAEIKTLLSKVGLLGEEVEKEHALSTETLAKCQKLEDELSKKKHEADLQHEAELRRVASCNEELRIKQEKELAFAASKFAECQKTISSLGRQLKSLKTMKDFLLDSENSLDLTGEGLQCPINVGEHWKSPSGDKCNRVDSESFKLIDDSLTLCLD